MGDNCCCFDYGILEKVIKSIIKGKLGDEDFPMSAIPTTAAKTCPTFVVAQTAHDMCARPTIFRTYSGTQIQASECAIWQAARATSAAPTFFMLIHRPPPAITYTGGGLGYNNPSEVALEEARRLWPSCAQLGFVSIGTGRPKANPIILNADAENSTADANTKMVSALAQLVANSEEVHQRMRKRIKDGTFGLTYLEMSARSGWKNGTGAMN
jgi:hypothetical protein